MAQKQNEMVKTFFSLFLITLFHPRLSNGTKIQFFLDVWIVSLNKFHISRKNYHFLISSGVPCLVSLRFDLMPKTMNKVLRFLVVALVFWLHMCWEFLIQSPLGFHGFSSQIQMLLFRVSMQWGGWLLYGVMCSTLMQSSLSSTFNSSWKQHFNFWEWILGQSNENLHVE